MAGRIKAEDVASVKERASIEDVVREHVTLRPAGIGALKGLCPFHDEKTPSFNIRPSVGSWHCFGCGEGGDVISFVQKVDHLTFAEAVERLAGKIGMELHYEDGPRRDDGVGAGRRSRLVEAHRVAREYYAQLLLDTSVADARAGRDFMRARGFDGQAATTFGMGYAPRGGDQLVRQLRGKGFTDDELVTAGLAGRSARGLYDRFRGRLVWPIHDITGDPVGFGARRLYDDDRIEAKYLNTTETPIYKKSTLLYGLDLAKKSISRERSAVIVEGYTDVMACHLSGIETAVATCGTAFGIDHIKVLRRIMRDEAGTAPAKVIFTFDGDAAGQKAAMRAFDEDQRWASQSYVAVAPGGQDPCELRQGGGADAVRSLVEDAVPLFEFAVRTTISRFDLDTAEGRVQALRGVAPIISSIRDTSLRPEYVRTVSGWLGVDVEQVRAEVARAAKRPQEKTEERRQLAHAEPVDVEPSAAELTETLPRPDLRIPGVAMERQALQCLIQFPMLVAAEEVSRLSPEAFTAPAHRAIFEGVAAAAGPRAGESQQAYTARITEGTPAPAQPLVVELSVAPLPTRMDSSTGMPSTRFVTELLANVYATLLNRRIADAMSQLRRLETSGHAGSAEHRELGARLHTAQRELVELREMMS